MAARFFTIGVFGTTGSTFFESLKENRISHFCDLRQRRSLRGGTYKYANATELQARLAELGIEYRHVLELALTPEVRQIQVEADREEGVGISQRKRLSPAFAKAYRERRLDAFDLKEFLAGFPRASNVVLFCVEAPPKACHRSLVAERLAEITGRPVPDITPSGI